MEAAFVLALNNLTGFQGLGGGLHPFIAGDNHGSTHEDLSKLDANPLMNIHKSFIASKVDKFMMAHPTVLRPVALVAAVQPLAFKNIYLGDNKP